MKARLVPSCAYRMTVWPLILRTALLILLAPMQAQGGSPLRLERVVPLPSVKGRIDHMALDTGGQRLFIAALGNNTLEVVDLVAGTTSYTIRGLDEPQGVVLIPDLNRIVVTNGRDGSCRIYDAKSYQPVATVNLSVDADNIRYDPQDRSLLVAYGEGALARIDAKTGNRTGDVALSGHPESFQLEEAGSRIFVNLPTANQVAVIDRRKLGVIATWFVQGAGGVFPMALDETNHRLFVASRDPSKVFIFDTNTGQVVRTLEIARDADDIFFDGKNKRLYVSCGEGFLYVFGRVESDRYELQEKIDTASGARTALFAPEEGKLFLAVPHRGKQKAEIRIYSVQTDVSG